MEKDGLRKEVRQERLRMDVSERSFASHKACLYILKSDLFLNADIILNYIAVRDEADPFRITSAALHEHKAIAFPRCRISTSEMDFFCIAEVFEKKDFDLQFEQNKWGIPEPLPLQKTLFSCKKYKGKRITVIVPGCSFSAKGNRLGWGRGFYDKYLENLKIEAESHDCLLNIVGFAFDCQLKSYVPVEEHDVKMDFVVTQSGIIECR